MSTSAKLHKQADGHIEVKLPLVQKKGKKGEVMTETSCNSQENSPTKLKSPIKQKNAKSQEIPLDFKEDGTPDNQVLEEEGQDGLLNKLKHRKSNIVLEERCNDKDLFKRFLAILDISYLYNTFKKHQIDFKILIDAVILTPEYFNHNFVKTFGISGGKAVQISC